MNKEQGIELLKKHVKTDQLLRHSYAVGASMKSYAKTYGEDEKRWELIGLLHDIDYEKFPNEHPNHASELLKDTGLDNTFVDSIISHGLDMKVPRDTIERQCLHAVDEMTSFIIAVALMRPMRLDGLDSKSVKKKMKDKAFAKPVNREELLSAIEPLGIEFTEHIEIIVNGLIELEKNMQSEGTSLFA